MKNRKGFTLIELLAVILILGVIALIAIPQVNNVIRQARKGADEDTGNQIIKRAREYYTSCTINGNLTLEGTTCYGDFKNHLGTDGSTELDALTDKTLKTELNMTGDLPKLTEISVFKISNTGDVYLRFSKDGFTCENFTTAEDVDTLADSLTCKDAA